MIKHVSLDCWGTLLNSNKNYEIAREDFLMGIFDAPREEIKKAYWKAKKFLNWAGKHGDHHSHIDAINVFLRKMGRDPNLTTNKMYWPDWISWQLEDLFFANPPIMPENLAQTLNNLANKGITLNISSNTHFSRGAWIEQTALREVLHLFKFRLFSDECRAEKPHFSFYRMVVEKANHLPEDIAHFGDLDWADGAAANFGLQYIPVKNPEDLNSWLDKLVKME